MLTAQRAQRALAQRFLCGYLHSLKKCKEKNPNDLSPFDIRPVLPTGSDLLFAPVKSIEVTSFHHSCSIGNRHKHSRIPGVRVDTTDLTRFLPCSVRRKASFEVVKALRSSQYMFRLFRRYPRLTSMNGE